MPVLYCWNEAHFSWSTVSCTSGPCIGAFTSGITSVVTTPFSAYSFHPVESFLLQSIQ